MPNHEGTAIMIGNEGGGYAKITFLGYENYDGVNEKEYSYSGTGEIYQANKTGLYKLEVWGAQGGSGGKGGYSSGYIKLQKGEEIYIYVGGKGLDGVANISTYLKGGFNGGGNSGIPSYYSPSGIYGAALRLRRRSNRYTKSKSNPRKLV